MGHFALFSYHIAQLSLILYYCVLHMREMARVGLLGEYMLSVVLVSDMQCTVLISSAAHT